MHGEATLLTFAGAGFDVPSGGHLQGVQMRFYPTANRHVLFLSHDSETAGYLLAVEFAADLVAPGRVIHVHPFPSDGASPPLRHAGGFQLSGDVLAIGLEDNQQKTRSQVQFWDVADPTRLRPLEHLTILRSGEPEDQTAGGVALVRRKYDHLVAVANWDSRAIDFYASDDKPLADPACRFHQLGRWQVAGADTSHWRRTTTWPSIRQSTCWSTPRAAPIWSGSPPLASGRT